MVLSEVAKRLMMMSGSGASTCTAECGTNRHQPIDRGHHDHRPSGTSPARRTGPGTCETRLGRLRLAPVERRSIDPDAVENHGDLPCNGDLGFLHANSLRELHSPGLKRGPFLRPIKQNGRRFEQVASEKPVAPSRYLASARRQSSTSPGYRSTSDCASFFISGSGWSPSPASSCSPCLRF
jgi:hypothetical protein